MGGVALVGGVRAVLWFGGGSGLAVALVGRCSCGAVVWRWHWLGGVCALCRAGSGAGWLGVPPVRLRHTGTRRDDYAAASTTTPPPPPN